MEPVAHAPDASPGLRLPTECRVVHTRILRNMLAAEDSAAYWRHAGEPSLDGLDKPDKLAAIAFERRWFGMKSEARVRTLMADMLERFDAFPLARELLHRLGAVPSGVRGLVCHVHTQLADPIYRAFTGEFLSERRERGQTSIDRPAVAKWVDASFPGRWAGVTLTKFAANMLATAYEAGLVAGRRDPRKIALVHAPELVAGYTLYLLRGVDFKGTLIDNPYLRSLGITPAAFQTFAPRIPGIRYAELGATSDLAFTEPSLLAWGLRYLGGDA